jgi:hypothetical protein
MWRKLSINTKIIAVLFISSLSISFLWFLLYQRGVAQLGKEIEQVRLESDTLVLEDILNKQKEHLEKTISGLLAVRELGAFVTNPRDAKAKLVVDGMFLSLKAKSVIRFVLYDKDMVVVADNRHEGFPARSGRLPEGLRGLFEEAAKDFLCRFYFRGQEAPAIPIAAEFSAATVIANDQDQPIGFVEIALDPSVWMEKVATIAHCAVGLHDVAHHRFSRQHDPELFAKIEALLPGLESMRPAVASQIGDLHYLSTCVPLKGPDGGLVNTLWLTRDNTVQTQSQRKNLQIGLSLLGLLLLLCTALAVWVLKCSVVQPILHAIKGLKQSSRQMADASELMSTSSQGLAQGANEQSASLQQSSASLQELLSVTKQSAEHSRQADQLMRNANQLVMRADGSMGRLTNSMEGISQASEDTSRIVRTIDEIAFQTNLLALNAAVEGARAGEVGAGFCVVAEEVRNLARRAALAAASTAELIEGIKGKIHEGLNLVQSTAGEFQNVVSTTGEVAFLVSEIAESSRRQAEGIEEVNRSVREIEQVTQQNATGAEMSAGVSEEMDVEVERMKSLVDILVSTVTGTRESNQDIPVS